MFRKQFLGFISIDFSKLFSNYLFIDVKLDSINMHKLSVYRLTECDKDTAKSLSKTNY